MNSDVNLGAIKRGETLTTQTYQRLRQALMTGTLTPGEKVTGRRIAASLNVSLTPAREAIGRLVTEGGLEPGRNRAAYVPVLTPEKYREIMTIRLLLEGLAAEKAMDHLTGELLAQLESILQEMDDALDRQDKVGRMQKNAEFHFLIYGAANLPILASMIDSLWLQAGPTLSLLAPDYQHSRRGSRNHQQAIDAIRKGSAKALRAAIEKDLEDGTNFILPLLEKSRR